MITLHSLKSNPVKKKAKRLGRGSSSRGDYSGRGMKGQKSRSGVTGLKRRGTKSWLMKVPKQKGFTSPHAQKLNVGLSQLDKNFIAGDTVTPFLLIKKGLIKDNKSGVKVLGNGKLTKKLTVKAHGFSATAKKAIEKNGGQAELITVRKNVKNKADKKK